MKNPQRPTPRAISDGSLLSVHSIFLTIQGEGPHTGRPAVFLRLAGCNLQCPLCDTEYTEGAIEQPARAILAAIQGFAGKVRLVVITGGEPFRQNISPLIQMLLSVGFEVQIETNGHLNPQDDPNWHYFEYDAAFTVVVSPKTSRVADTIARVARAYKYVVRAGEIDKDGFPLSALDHPIGHGRRLARPPHYYLGPIYIQPADEKDDLKNEANLEAAAELVIRLQSQHGGSYRLGVQTHKIAGLA